MIPEPTEKKTLLKRVSHRNLLPLRHTVEQERQMLLRHEEVTKEEERHAAANERLVYEVEMVVAKKHDEEHGFLYWVKWKRHPWTASSFEPLYAVFSKGLSHIAETTSHQTLRKFYLTCSSRR